MSESISWSWSEGGTQSSGTPTEDTAAEHGPLSSGSSTGSGAGMSAKTQRKPMPRKGHTKSRGGCLTCKRRKVKCDEKLPECSHCRRIGFSCHYPARPAAIESPSPMPGSALQPTPTTFSLDDLHFFQHFLLTAHPTLPIGGKAVWRHVAQLAHSFDFLIHSMLALGAQHLTTCTNSDYTSQALAHRIKAIRALNVQLSKRDPSTAEGDAAFGAVMSLTFQSSYLPDGMMDYISMIRGCHIVAAKAMPNFAASSFNSFSLEGHISDIHRYFNGRLPASIASSILQESLDSMRRLVPLCKTAFQLSYIEMLQNVMMLSMTGSANTAHYEYTKMYTVFGQMSNDDWTAFIDPKNHTSQLLLLHFLVMDHLMGAMYSHEAIPAVKSQQQIGLVWMDRIARSMPLRYKPYAAWPLELVNRMTALRNKPLGAQSNVASQAGNTRERMQLTSSIQDYLPITSL